MTPVVRAWCAPAYGHRGARGPAPAVDKKSKLAVPTGRGLRSAGVGWPPRVARVDEAWRSRRAQAPAWPEEAIPASASSSATTTSRHPKRGAGDRPRQALVPALQPKVNVPWGGGRAGASSSGSWRAPACAGGSCVPPAGRSRSRCAGAGRRSRGSAGRPPRACARGARPRWAPIGGFVARSLVTRSRLSASRNDAIAQGRGRRQ